MVKGVAWTALIFGLGQALRIVSSVIMTRLLAPETFGIMVIVYALLSGIEMFSEFGFGQNLIISRDADKPEFYNTIWSLRLARSLLLWGCCLAAAMPLARFYHTPVLNLILPIIGLNFVLQAIGSIGPIFLQKRLQTAKFNLFQSGVEAVTTVSQIIYAYFNPSVWAIVFGSLTSSVAYMFGSYFLVPGLRHRFYLSNEYVRQILSFGKWILLSSAIYFLSASFDNLYFGKVVPLELLGVYGIARNIADALANLVGRVNNIVILPFIAAHSEMPRSDLRQQLTSIRVKFLLAAAFGFSILVTFADVIIRILYDYRYQSAAWIFSLMLIAKWFWMLSGINEAPLIAFSRPYYGASSSAVKFGVLLIGLPLAFVKYGFAAAIIVVVISEILRYVPLLIGQVRERFLYVYQDIAMTLCMFALIGLFEWLRFAVGFGTSFGSFQSIH